MKRTLKVFAILFATILVMGFTAHAQSVSFWTQSATSPWLTDAVKRFTAETGIEVELRHIGWGTEELFVAFAADVPPDLFSHGQAALGAIASLGVLEDMEPYLDRWTFTRDIVPTAMDSGLYEGRYYAVPFSGVPIRDLFYRVDFFEEAGLDSNHPPRHWEDLVDYGRKLVRRSPEGGLVRSAINVGMNEQLFTMLLRQSGGDLLQDGLPQLDTPEATTALEFQVGLMQQHHLDEPNFTSWIDILTGNTAMVWTEAQFYFQQQHEGLDLLRVGTYPYSLQPATFVGTNIMAVPQAASNKEGALALIEFLLRPDQHEILSRATGQIPFYTVAANWDWVRGDPIVLHLMNALSYGYPNPAHEKWFDIRAILRESISSVFAQAQSPRNALIQANERITAILGE